MNNKGLILFLASLGLALLMQAQAPQKIDFQAVARNDAGQLIAEQLIGVKFSIGSGPSGDFVYSEQHDSVYTDGFGLFTTSIGTGNATLGTFSGIEWANGNFFVTIEIDPEGGTNYLNMGTLEMMSVPYALYADRAAYGEDDDADPNNELNSEIKLEGTDLQVTDGGGTLAADLSSLIDDADADPTNELNSGLEFAGDTLKLSDANGILSVDLSDLIDDADSDPYNELIADVMLDGTNLMITDSGGTSITNLVSLVDDADADPGNELITDIILDGTDLKVTDAGGTSVASLAVLIDDADADPSNEMNLSLSLSGESLQLTDPDGMLTADLSSLVNDDDADTTNEIQNLLYDGQMLSISEGNSVGLPWKLNNNIAYYNDGLVGIGTNSPAGPLDVSTVFYTQPGRFIIRQEGTTGEGGQITLSGSGAYNEWHIDNYAGYYRLFHDTINAVRITPLGNVGIGVMNAAERLTVAGNLKLLDAGNSRSLNLNTSDGLLALEAAGADLWINTNAGGNVQTALRINHNTGRVGIGNGNPDASLDVNGDVKIGANGAVVSEIIEITGQTNNSSGFTSIAYPSGYDKFNTRIMSVEIEFGVFGNIPWHTLGYAISTNHVSLGCSLGNNIDLSYADVAGYHSSNYRIMLMRVE